ncbi:hypothetical protein [Flavobacterium sp. HBTb2-11-1]|uniref:hypothetical protein n=1 Tax=Flavobacterium sp. HBTb2-11-1 TaxID=2692212 RepID=UPI00136DAFE3|nr:hypothetical protein [Flavobacterium sp. HBTb2-11-1]MXO03491.1 hypothetical protein [Flavobacterium sp. HBTb2-11-1]
MKLEEIKSKIYAKLAMHSLEKIREDLSKAKKDSALVIEDIKKSLSNGGEAAYENLEKKAQKFYDSLPEESKKHYHDLLSKIDEFKSEVKKMTEEQIKQIESKYSENINY